MSVASAALLATIQGLHRDYGNGSAPAILEFMPPVDQDSLEAQFLVADQDIFPDARDPVTNANATAQFHLLSSTYSRETITTAIKQGFAEVIPERITQSVASAAGVNLVNRSLKKVLDIQHSAVLTNGLTTAATLAATAMGSGTLDLSVQTDIQKFFNGVIDEIEIATGSTEGICVYMGVPQMRALLTQDQVFRGPGIAVATGAATAQIQRRLDAAEESVVAEFFATKLTVPVKLIVERFIYRNASAALARQFATGIYMARVGANGVQSWGQLFYQTLPSASSQDGPVALYTADVGPQQLMEPGVLVASAGAWVAKLLATGMGRRMATTLPS